MSRASTGRGSAGNPVGPVSPLPSSSNRIIHSREWARDVRTMFSRAAPRYDFMNRVMSLGRDLSWRRFAIGSAAFPQGSRILDLGSGTGDMAREVVRCVPESLVFGIDNCPALMERARLKRGLEKTRWLLGDGGHLPFASDCFDGAVAAFSLRNMADLPQVLSEIYRVILPGGRFVVLDLVRPEGHLCGAAFWLHCTHIIPALGNLLGTDPEAYAYLPRSIESFYSFRGLREELRRHGFKELHSRSMMFRTVAVCISAK